MEGKASWEFEKQGKDDCCPACGRDGYGHITTFIKGEIGRECACGATWPIDVALSAEAGGGE